MRLGKLQIDLVTDGMFWLDGGTMFGMVPKPLWEKLVEPDARNRVEQAMNSLLVRGPHGCALIEAGFGRKLSEKQQRIYSLDPATDLVRELAKKWVTPEDVDLVVLTHLHIDHAGWCTTRREDGALEPTFPRARCVVQAAELHDARRPSPLTAGSYSADDFEPLAAQGLLCPVNGEADVAPGIRVQPTGGHTRGHQAVVIESGRERCTFAGDIVPTASHLRLTYGTAYDNFPLDVVEAKRALLEEAATDGAYVVFPLEPRTPVARIARRDDGQFGLATR